MPCFVYPNAIESANTSPSVAPPPEAAVVCLVLSGNIIPSADTLPLTPIPPFEIMAPVIFDVEVVVLLATNIFEYTTLAPAIIPPTPVPVVILVAVKFTVVKFVETLMLFTLSVAIDLLKVKEECL